MKIKLLPLLLLLSSIPVYSQLGILAIPSADVTPIKGVYERTDLTYKPSNAASTLTQNFMFGIGVGTELYINAVSISHPNRQPLALQSGFKTVHDLVRNKTTGNGMAIFGGTTFSTVLYNGSSDNRNMGLGAYTYAATAISLGKNRITSGAWNSQDYYTRANTSGGMLGYEYKFNGQFLAAIDWSTGNSGSFTTGLLWFPNTRIMVVPAYQIGNVGALSGTNQAVLYIGFQIK